MEKRLLLGASYSVIEPLGLLHLGGLARDLGWERQFHLVKDHDFEEFFRKVRDFKPSVVGFNVYTGNHIQLSEAFKRLKQDHPNIITTVGGPHPTYFPVESLQFADYVVMSEGFGPFEKILQGKVPRGIYRAKTTHPFPHPDRKTFYKQYPDHGKSHIKSLITMTGFPYSCTYCYNSSTIEDIKEHITPEIAKELGQGLGMSGRLFPHNVRSVDDVLKEGREIAENWPTNVIYFQDDVYGIELGDWMPAFAKRWPNDVGIPYHAQMRWEMTGGEGGKKRLDLVCESGCFGLTLAIEAADQNIRRDVLSRAMPEELMFKGMQELMERDLRVRTEQITALPYGATIKPTAMNLDADLQLVELNVKLKNATRGPTMAWASTLAPYRGTKLGGYCEQFGHYTGDNSDVPDTFFDRSVLRFPKEWIGLKLEKRKKDQEVWLSQNELEHYRDQNAELRRIFNFVTLIPDGQILARAYLESREPFTFERLGRETIHHLRTRDHHKEASSLLQDIVYFRFGIPQLTPDLDEQNRLNSLAAYFGCLPQGKKAAQRFLAYGRMKGFSPKTLSDATRHHLYDEVLYATNSPSLVDQKKEISLANERYPSKV